ncbi:MAG: formate dehydrogenase [Burkholderiales bacterium]|jgi:formate dehydrogenase|nr:formate dehydrogenase [Burkholderiales bacterium]
MNKLTILCVLYPDPKNGMPKVYARDNIPKISQYPNGQLAPDMSNIDFIPGSLLGSVSGGLGLKKFLEDQGHRFIITSDKEGENSEFEKYLPEADIVISQPFWPAYLTKERIAKAPKLKLAVTAGIGSDHVDLAAAIERNITVAEVTFCNSISVAEHNVMMILSLVRDYLTQHEFAKAGLWDIADCVSRSYDLEGMHVGVVGSGRIGLAVLRRLNPFGVHLHYYDKYRLSPEIEKELNLIYHNDVSSLAKVVDIVSINCPLHPETEDMFNAQLIGQMKRGAYIVNTARGKICNREAIKQALESGHLAGYAGDVWFPQPAPADHPWRTMPFNGMTPHTSGTSLSAQTRYAAGVLEILKAYFGGEKIREEYLIVDGGALAGTGKHSYTTAA